MKIDLNPSPHRADRPHRQTVERGSETPHELLNEPGAILPLQRQLFVVHNDGIHGLSNRSAALCPDRTALSIVAGKPVSVQSPARYSPRTAVSAGGRTGCPGAKENVACRSRTTDDRTRRAARA